MEDKVVISGMELSRSDILSKMSVSMPMLPQGWHTVYFETKLVNRSSDNPLTKRIEKTVWTILQKSDKFTVHISEKGLYKQQKVSSVVYISFKDDEDAINLILKDGLKTLKDLYS